MKIIETKFKDVKIIEPTFFEDERGFFMESYSKKDLAEAGIHCEFVQDNHSSSVRGTLRGMHYQAWPGGQVKLVRCPLGHITDVIVDIRPDSDTFLKHEKFELTSENNRQLLVPNGFAHGFVVRSEYAEVQYKCSWYYEPKLEKGYMWNDPAFEIDWDIEDPILSERDKKNPTYEVNLF